ncbi:MAG: phosphoenolpyruvate--protein phosphotransferase [Syntrophaceae bacterium]|nr:phosphoenolpyruvate--protein phosphotransferase [Syntrophaceae bacterium]
MDYLNLFLDIGQLDWVFKGSSSIETLLGNIVAMVAKYMRADVCSIYIHDDVKGKLVLRANTGFQPHVVGEISLKPGEGIVGTVFEKNEPVCISDGFTHPNFRYFKGTGEERYKAFLAVPIVSGENPVGVLTLQRQENNRFEDSDIKALQIVASQLATVFENIRMIISLQQTAPSEITREKKEQLERVFLKGKAASRGYAYAKAVLAVGDERFHEIAAHTFEDKYDLSALQKALKKTENELISLQKAVEDKLSDAASMIFNAHLLILKDKSFIAAMTAPVQKGKNAPEAVIAAGQKYINLFSASPNPYIREKVHDIEDLVTRIIKNLAGKEAKLPPVRRRIAVAADLYPSDLLKLSSEGVKGIVLLSGGVTSHVSILARSLQIPMVIVNDPVAGNISDGDHILIDGEIGNIFVNPAKDVVKEFKDRIDEQTAGSAPPVMKKITQTKDGVRIKLKANINLLKDLELLQQLPCDGIGLYRSEFPFIIRQNFPTEEEQFFVYRKLVEGTPSKDITFRTLDIGGDKMPAYWEPVNKENPFLGLRSIRFSLKHQDIFTQQIRAILRAGAESELKIMFPMIFSLDEFLQAKDIVLECVKTLEKSGVVVNTHPQIGMMVEVPAVIEIIEEFAQVVDFFSIGTNDLVQYMLAVDRTNEDVAEYYIPHHPAVLRAIKRVVDAANAAGKEVSICGDMAQKAGYLQFLIGCGIRTLSMNPIYFAENQKIIGEIEVAQAEALTRRLLASGDIKIIENELFPS